MSRVFKTVLDHVLTYALLTFLAGLTLGWTVLALVLIAPLPRRWRQSAARAAISGGYRLFAGALVASGAYELDLSALDELRGGPPVILAPNHPTLIDAILILTRHPNLVCVLKPQLLNNFFLGAGARMAGYIRGWPPRRMIREAIDNLRQGSVLLLFPEGTRTTAAPTGPLTASVAVIAKHARVPVQTAIIETDSPYLSKGWSLFRAPTLPIRYRVRLGKRFEAPDDVGALMEELEREYRTQLAAAPQTSWLGEINPSDSANQLMHPR
jgi:1-acyl-sn-glycerol-3-phosphate acyltransferase